MKFVLMLAFCFGAQAQTLDEIHILPDSPGWVYRAHYQLDARDFFKSDDVTLAIQLGERNLDWLIAMNSVRDETHKIHLTKRGELHSTPIEAAELYNAATISKTYRELQSQIPAEMAQALSAGAPYPQNPPVDEDVYIMWAKKLDRNYQLAARWKMMQPYLSQLKLRRAYDLRGFYFLTKKTADVQTLLNSYRSLPQDQQKQISAWLEQMCMNSEGLSANCAANVLKAAKSNQLFDLYSKYLPASQALWDSYFQIKNPRSDVEWSTKNPSQMLVPFQDPKDDTILDFLKVNIEEEWALNAWRLILDFKKSALIHVEFEPGSVPHVDSVGGSKITMDENAPLSEWDVQWTIRHEFGHTLGFVDCYEEFFDPAQNGILQYQLDIENLMCSRAGTIKQIHFDELKLNYQRTKIQKPTKG